MTSEGHRTKAEVEIFLRFSEIAVETKKRDVIQAGMEIRAEQAVAFAAFTSLCAQARGVSMSSLTWRDVVVKLLSNEAHLPLQSWELSFGEL